jgi:phosphate transport system substrate-binding protein
MTQPLSSAPRRTRHRLWGAAALTIGLLLAGCGSPADSITVITREAGSGTRSAFNDLFDLVATDGDTTTDLTSAEALIARQTDVMMTQVAQDDAAIGYISLGSLNDTVKALAIDGVTATPEHVRAGSYQVSRPFLLATDHQLDDLVRDFVDFTLSASGQAIIDQNYVAAIAEPDPYQGLTDANGTIVVAGSSSVAPVLEKLSEAYQAVQPEVKIEIQTSDSSTGLGAVRDGTADIAMSSRELKDSESSQLTAVTIAQDGIAVIVSPANPVDGLTSAQIKDIFTGTTTSWDGLSA